MSPDSEDVPRASPAAWSPDAAPPPAPSRILSLDEFEAHSLAAASEARAATDAEPAVQPPSEPEAQPEPEPEPESAPELPPAAEVEPPFEAGLASAVRFVLPPVDEPEPEPERAPEAEPEPEAQAEAPAEAAPDASTIRFVLPPVREPELVPGLETNFDYADGPEALTGAAPEPIPAAPEPQPEWSAQPDPEPEPEPEPEPQWHADPEPEPEPEPEPVLAPEPAAQVEAPPVPWWQPEPEPGSEPDAEPEPQAASADAAPARPDRLTALREIARRLRTAPDAESTLQYVVELACECTGAEAGMLTVTVPENRQVVFGRALGAGPYISVQLRAGGPTFGELVLTRLADAAEFETSDETFAELVAEYVAKAVSGLRRGTVLSDEQQDFIDRITEELRSPLAGTVNLIDSVVGGQVAPLESRVYLERAADDNRRMLRLIDDLLHIARLRPPEPREMEAIPVGPWLRKAVDAARPRAEAAGHELKLAEPGGAYIVKGVPVLLDLVIHHLLDNAIKFSEQPGPIDVSAVPAEGLLRICVADQGIGFDAGDASRMLDCFARAINAEAARIPGAGVGLFLASEIVRGHGGRLWLDSRRDEGTQAYAALPFDG